MAKPRQRGKTKRNGTEQNRTERNGREGKGREQMGGDEEEERVCNGSEGRRTLGSEQAES